MATVEDVRGLGSSLERSYPVYVRDRLRFNWIHADLATLEPAEAREFVVDAWRMVVPKKVSRAYDLAHPDGPG